MRQSAPQPAPQQHQQRQPVDAPAVPGDAFRAALSKFATGVTVITARGAQGPVGITVNSFASLSLDPPLVLWSLGKSSNRLALFETAEHYAVHVLAENQHDLCRAFTRDAAAFGAGPQQCNAMGVPVIADCLARFDCARHAVHEGGDHLIFVAHVDAVTVQDTAPLIFFDRGFGAFEARPSPKRGA